MKSYNRQAETGIFENKVIHYSLQLLALSILIYFCFEIIKPFITLFIWGSVLAISLYPLHKKLTGLLKGRKWISAVIITIVMYLLVIGPATMLMLATVDEFKILSAAYSEGALQIPPPNENVKNWPVIGNKIYELWNEASVNISGLITKNASIIKPVILKAISLLSNAGMGILLLMASFLVAGFMMVYGEEGKELAKMFFARLAGKQGNEMKESVAITVRNVAKGVIGVAFIQGIMAGIWIGDCQCAAGWFVGFNRNGFMYCADWNDAGFDWSNYLYLECRRYYNCCFTYHLDAFYRNY
ncbi:MAG: AI-2E family transporter [Draconibacterium sp.]|nr:AI-2E family transporter [Draconibacterium sp.]